MNKILLILKADFLDPWLVLFKPKTKPKTKPISWEDSGIVKKYRSLVKTLREENNDTLTNVDSVEKRIVSHFESNDLNVFISKKFDPDDWSYERITFKNGIFAHISLDIEYCAHVKLSITKWNHDGGYWGGHGGAFG